MRIKDVLGSILFGFVDGFFSGMATDLYDDWNDEDSACQDKQKRDNVSKKFAELWEKLKEFLRNTWPPRPFNGEWRQQFMDSFRNFLRALWGALCAITEFALSCPTTIKLGTIILVISVMAAVTLFIILAGLVIIPLIIKIIGIITGIFFFIRVYQEYYKGIIYRGEKTKFRSL